MRKIILFFLLLSFILGIVAYAEDKDPPCSCDFKKTAAGMDSLENHPCKKILEKLAKGFEKEHREILARGIRSLFLAGGGALSHDTYTNKKSKGARKTLKRKKHYHFMDKIEERPHIDHSTKDAFINLLTYYRFMRDELDKKYNERFKELAKEIKKKNKKTVSLEDLISLTLYMDPTKDTEIDLKIDRLDIDTRSRDLLRQFKKEYYQKRNHLFKVCVCQEKTNTCLVPSRALKSDPYEGINLHK